MRSLDFFAGSGLVRLGLEPEFETVWANDNSAKKAAVYNANEPNRPLHLGSITDVSGAELPEAELAWASFPCQDLSLAGNLTGIRRGTDLRHWQRAPGDSVPPTKAPHETSSSTCQQGFVARY